MRSCPSPDASFQIPRRLPDREADAIVGAATAYVPAHGAFDFGVGRALHLGEQRRRAHDLARLAIAALRHVVRDPASCSTLPSLVWPIPSMVVIFLPAAALRDVEQDRAGWPFMCTVHAPHSAMPQP